MSVDPVTAEGRKAREPRMTINGVELTPAQAMTLRVALGSFYMSVDVDGLGEDEHGRFMAAAYKAHATAIYSLMESDR